MMHIQAIKILISEGHRVLQVAVNPETDKWMFFLVNQFQESTVNAAESIDSCVLSGMDITPFLSINSANPDRNNFLANLNQILLTEPIIRVNFHKDILWTLWSNAAKL